MRSLLVLVALLGVAIADDDGCVCNVHRSSGSSKRATWAMNYGGARLESQELRIAQLSKQLDRLAHYIEDDDTDHHYNRVVSDLEHRLEHIEGDDCHEHQFSCGRKSGQCVSDLLVCDHKNDCENGHDEDKHICHNETPVGRSWSGRANWSGCINRHHNQMAMLITGNKRMEHFPSVMWLDAVIITKWTEDHHEVTKSWSTHGYYEYAHQRIVLEPPEGSDAFADKEIGMICEDAGEGVADCRMIKESDGHSCGHAILTRAV